MIRTGEGWGPFRPVGWGRYSPAVTRSPAAHRAPALRSLSRRVARLLEAPARDPDEPLAPAFARQAERLRGWREEPAPRAERDAPAALADLETFLARHFPAGDPWTRAGLEEAAAEGEPVSLRWSGEGCLLLDQGPGGLSGLVHPDLGGALRRALDRFVREALFDPQALADPKASAALAARIEALRRLAIPLFEALAAVEAVRLAVARGPRGVVSSAWCFTLDRLPVELRRHAATSTEQRAAWSEALGKDLAPDALDPTLVVDTGHHSPAEAAALIEALGDLEAARDGLLIRGDNAHALRLLAPRFAGAVQCAYLDPPFNTATHRAYPDRLDRAAWLSFMDERLRLCRDVLRPDGTLYAHIDQHEKERLRLLLDRHLEYVAEVIWRIGWVSGFKTRANKFIRNHDTIYQYGRSPRPLFLKQYLPYPEGYLRRDGKPPTGKGIPLEDTWNCSAADRLDSIQIMSFSREKVGRGDLTQKNENLLERMLVASSRPGDWVLDPFLGSGTGCAAAHKLGRRWIGIDRGATLDEVVLPRLLRVLQGDPYGISKGVGWQGGGAFERLELEGTSSVLARALGAEGAPLDLVVSLTWLLGLRVRRQLACGEGVLLAGEDPRGAPVLIAGPACVAGAERVAAAAAALPSGPGRVLRDPTARVEAPAKWGVADAREVLRRLLDAFSGGRGDEGW